jgi:hypothetical protein
MDQFEALVALAVQRLALAEYVAVAKFASGQAIDDPIREREILDSVARRLIKPCVAQALKARGMGCDVPAGTQWGFLPTGRRDTSRPGRHSGRWRHTVASCQFSRRRAHPMRVGESSRRYSHQRQP